MENWKPRKAWAPGERDAALHEHFFDPVGEIRISGSFLILICSTLISYLLADTFRTTRHQTSVPGYQGESAKEHCDGRGIRQLKTHDDWIQSKTQAHG